MVTPSGTSFVPTATCSGMPGTWIMVPGLKLADGLTASALQIAEAKQDMPLNTMRRTPASAATRRVNTRKKSETSASDEDGSDARNSANGPRRSPVACMNVRCNNGHERASVDSTTYSGSGRNDRNRSTTRPTDAGRRLRAKATLPGVVTRVMRSLPCCAESAVAKWSSGSMWPFTMKGKMTTWSRPDLDTGMPLPGPFVPLWDVGEP